MDHEKYQVKWVNSESTLRLYPATPRIGKKVVEALNLGAFIMSLINDNCVIIQCEPIG